MQSSISGSNDVLFRDKLPVVRIGYVSSEVVPYAATGGLGDVTAALPKVLVGAGVEGIRFMPLYQVIDRTAHGLKSTKIELLVPLGRKWDCGAVWIHEIDGIRTCFIENREYFDRPGNYGIAWQEYADNFERFVFFQKAVVRLIDQLKLQVDVVHCNDWQTGLIPMFLQYGVDGKGRAKTEKCIFSIHNLAYVREIQTGEFGCRMGGVLDARRDMLRGIINGVDYEIWNPETDPYLYRNYSIDDLSGKRACKQFLQSKAGFKKKFENSAVGHNQSVNRPERHRYYSRNNCGYCRDGGAAGHSRNWRCPI